MLGLWQLSTAGKAESKGEQTARVSFFSEDTKGWGNGMFSFDALVGPNDDSHGQQ